MHEDAYRKKLMRVPNGLVFGIAEGFSESVIHFVDIPYQLDQKKGKNL